MSTPTVLYFDLGNTNSKVGVAKGDGPISAYALPTNERQTADQFGLALLEILRHEQVAPSEIEACVGSSVVPGMSQLVGQATRRFLEVPLLLAPEDIPIPLENRYTRPHEVGADRLAGAFAARRLFPDAPTIITVDFGTATTFDCVDGNAYLGGLICPGVQSSINALASNTAKLPRVNFEIVSPLPQAGLSTATSLSHGFVFGFASMAEGLCARLGATLSHPPLVVGTGGFAKALSAVATCFHEVRPDLLLDGLRIIYNEYTKNGR